MDNKQFSEIIKYDKKALQKILSKLFEYDDTKKIIKDLKGMSDNNIYKLLKTYPLKKNNIEERNESRIDDILRLIPVKGMKNYLDIGIMNGNITQALGEKIGILNDKKWDKKEIYGIDINSMEITEYNKNITFYKYEGNKLPSEIKKRKYSLITVFVVLHHINKNYLYSLLNDIYSVLDEDGFFIIREHDYQKDNKYLLSLLNIQHGLYSILYENMSIEEFQSQKETGFYKSKKEWKDIIMSIGFLPVKIFSSNLTEPTSILREYYEVFTKDVINRKKLLINIYYIYLFKEEFLKLSVKNKYFEYMFINSYYNSILDNFIPINFSIDESDINYYNNNTDDKININQENIDNLLKKIMVIKVKDTKCEIENNYSKLIINFEDKNFEYKGKIPIESEQYNLCILSLIYSILYAPNEFLSIPSEIIKIMNITIELFATPFNNTVDKYYSMFPKIERGYGSIGNFEEIKLNTSDIYLANCPNNITIINKLYDKIKNTESSMFIIIPIWEKEERNGFSIIEQFKGISTNYNKLPENEYKYYDFITKKLIYAKTSYIFVINQKNINLEYILSNWKKL